MTPYRHILLAIDFSEYDEQIAAKASRLAKKYQAKLSIVHVLDNIPMPDTNYGTAIPLNEATGYDLLEKEKTDFIRFADSWHIDQDNRWLVWGIPKNEIVDMASRLHVDLIVLGSHGRYGIRLLFGSTANSVIHHARCDVLAVRLRDFRAEV